MNMNQLPLATAQGDSLTARCPGRPLRVVLAGFYNYDSHALRIFHPLLKQRGHEVHSIFFKNYFTYSFPTQREEDMFVELIERIRPDVVGMSVWSTYFKLAGRLSQRIKASVNPVIIWGGIHAQVRPEACLDYADIACQSEGEHVLVELTDRVSLGRDYDDLQGCWVRRNGEVVHNPPRQLIPDLDILPPADMSPENKYYLGAEQWRNVGHWDSQAVLYDVMAVRGCPFRCTFCVHNFTRKATEGLGTYVRRRSVDHVMSELHAAIATRPQLRTITFSDDLFAPPRPWLEEFCERYKREIGLPWAIYTFPAMVDEAKIRLMSKAGLWATVMGIQSGSARIRRDCYERETSNEEIVGASRIFAKYGVQRTFDFIGDNPYENEQDLSETVDLLAALPKPFYFNYFSLTFFPGVALTERALHDGHIKPEDVEDVAEKGYRLYGGSFVETRSPDELAWDVSFAMAVHGFPAPIIHRLRRSGLMRDNIHAFIRLMRAVRVTARGKTRALNWLFGRPDLFHQHWRNANRETSAAELVIQPNFDNSPMSSPLRMAPGA
jgi:radical SAM superfamily enzyme YgiQ (UPF0313 family)